jgi:hypothetical protein
LRKSSRDYAIAFISDINRSEINHIIGRAFVKCGWILLLFASAAAAQSTLDLTQRYLFLNTIRESTMKRGLDEAAAVGYRVLAGAGSRDLVLEKVSRPPDTYQYLLAHNREEVKAAGVKGFRLRPLVRARRGDKQEQCPGSIEPWMYSTVRLSDDPRVVRLCCRDGDTCRQLRDAG